MVIIHTGEKGMKGIYDDTICIVMVGGVFMNHLVWGSNPTENHYFFIAASTSTNILPQVIENLLNQELHINLMSN